MKFGANLRFSSLEFIACRPLACINIILRVDLSSVTDQSRTDTVAILAR